MRYVVITAYHARARRHTALFGVYGMLGIGLMLYCLRALRPGRPWREGWVAAAFYQRGAATMVVFSVLPVGLPQTHASVEVGYWYTRSSEFLQTGLMNALRWSRVFGDIPFAAGAGLLTLFVDGLATGRSYRPSGTTGAGPRSRRATAPAE